MFHTHVHPRGQTASIVGRGLLLACFLFTVLSPGPTSVLADTAAPTAPDWLEPKGLNVMDLVGRVPEGELKGAILFYESGFGILRYESGQRSGNQVTAITRAHTRLFRNGSSYFTLFGCLGQPAVMDQLGSIAPATTMRVQAGGKDVTRELTSFSYIPAGLNKPVRNAQAATTQLRPRYDRVQAALNFNGAGELVVPANMGCQFMIGSRNYTELVVTFKATVAEALDVRVVSAESFTFRSYLGPGGVGHLTSLVNQLHAAGYADRHDKFTLHPPAEADFFLLNFPPIPADPYPEPWADNAGRPGSGSYRIVIPPGLSVDHTVSMGLPLRGHWQDIDQNSGAWLAYSREYRQLAAPEYVLPAGVAYNACMANGGCSADILARVYNTTMTMRIVYLRVDRGASYTRVPVQIPGTAATTAAAPALAPATAGRRAYLPLVLAAKPSAPVDDATGCSPRGGCGWFASDGRMLDYVPYR